MCRTSRCCRTLWPGLRSVWMGAGPVPEIWHRALNALAWLVRLRVLPSLSPFAGLMYRTINVLSWGEHRGGMFVAVEGDRARRQRDRALLALLAEADDGPLIPSMAAEAIIRHCLAGRAARGRRARGRDRSRAGGLRGAVRAPADHHRPPAVAAGR